MPAEDGPTPPTERIVALDALRGFALLGILIINIQVMAMPEVVLLNPTAYGDFTGANYWAWLFSDIFARQKFITLFTFLFGAGVILFTRKPERAGQSTIALFHRRSLWLIAFGLAHAYLLWYGDILVTYGICAFGVVLVRSLPAMKLARIGIYLLLVPTLIEVVSAALTDPAVLATTWYPSAETLQTEIAAYRGSWSEQLTHRAPASLERQTGGFLIYSAWHVSGSMLLGMALFKWGVLTNDRSTQWYLRLIAGGAALGLTIILAGLYYIHAANWDPQAGIYWRQFNYWGSIPLAASYVGVIMLYTRSRPDGPITTGLAAVGRTAFSNYILQTILATSLFYGHGLGLFGHLERIELLGVVVLIWAIQIPLSVLWLRYFRFGPLEWLWRVLTYRSMQPMRVE